MTADTDPTELEIRRRLALVYKILLECARKKTADPRLVSEAGHGSTADKAPTLGANTQEGYHNDNEK